MSEEALILAIGRLERALARVETAAARPIPQPAAPVIDNGAEEALQALGDRHDRLKQQIEGTIAALDRLIEKG